MVGQEIVEVGRKVLIARRRDSVSCNYFKSGLGGEYRSI